MPWNRRARHSERSASVGFSGSSPAASLPRSVDHSPFLFVSRIQCRDALFQVAQLAVDTPVLFGVGRRLAPLAQGGQLAD
jgi:hypothetical protein